MTNGIEAPVGFFSSGIPGLRRNWGWLLVLGILLIVLGIIALVDVATVSLVSMLFFGWVLIVAGVIEAIQAFRHRHAHRLWLHVLNAALAIVVGAMLTMNPVAGLLLITLLLAFYFTVAGIFRIAAAVAVRIPGWGWSLTNGIVTLILGILIWAHWPSSSLVIVGLFIGIDLIILGWSETMLALALRRLAA